MGQVTISLIPSTNLYRWKCSCGNGSARAQATPEAAQKLADKHVCWTKGR